MKSFTLLILSVIVAVASAVNEPVASSTAEIERELAEYERQLGTDITGTPTGTPPRVPTPVSINNLPVVWLLLKHRPRDEHRF